MARVAELSITGALLGAHLSGWVRDRAVDAIAGRRAPFIIDGDCTLACACEWPGAESPPAASSGLLASPAVESGRPCAALCIA
jgi:hypothetical protein